MVAGVASFILSFCKVYCLIVEESTVLAEKSLGWVHLGGTTVGGRIVSGRACFLYSDFMVASTFTP